MHYLRQRHLRTKLLNRFSSIGSTSAAIAQLLFHRSPSAISRLIIPVIVYAIYGMLLGWTSAHISIKVREIQPSCANANSSSSVMFESIVIPITAPSAHGNPNSILRQKPTTMTKKRRVLSATLPASLRTSTNQLRTNTDCLATAITNTEPASFPRCTILSTFNDGQLTKSFPNKIMGT